jgi:hypothetical protein
MAVEIPYTKWTPLSVEQVVSTFATAPFVWCLAGGYAVEQFLGVPIRTHSDIDVVIYRDDQLRLWQWLADWRLYAADPPGNLRTWAQHDYLGFGIHDIWGHRVGADAWQLQIMLAEVEGEEWFSHRDSSIRGHRDDLITPYNGVPCIRIEVQLMYKANNVRPKDELDFRACAPLMNVEAKRWLKEKLCKLYPHGHSWLDALM